MQTPIKTPIPMILSKTPTDFSWSFGWVLNCSSVSWLTNIVRLTRNSKRPKKLLLGCPIANCLCICACQPWKHQCRPSPRWNKGCSEVYRLTKDQFRRDLKDHVVRSFLAKAQFRQDGPVQLSLKNVQCRAIHHFPREFCLIADCSHCEKISSHVKLESSQE